MAATLKQRSEPDDWILIDLDNAGGKEAQRSAAIARSVLEFMYWGIRIGKTVSVKSPSGKGWHILLPIYLVGHRRLPHVNIILVQALAGSDLGREKANFFRAERGVKNWNRLFCTKRLPLE